MQLAAAFDQRDQAHGMDTYCLVDERGTTTRPEVRRTILDALARLAGPPSAAG